MSGILWEWLSFAVRWLHVIAGIAWIGSSFYFIHTDLALKAREGLPDKAHGETWQVHGGGFYHIVKYLVAPDRLPDKLTWFKWEAYATFLSGFALMVIVYYFSAELYLIDRQVLKLEVWQAVGVSLGGLILGWLLYDGLCRSPIGDNDKALAAVGFVFLVVLAWAFTKVFSGRGAYMQMGALIGTMMVLNVLAIIIPGQRKVVADLIAGRAPDPIHGKRAKQRSVHNNYLTLPVVFVMISNHYPLAFATRWSWLILALVIIMGAVIRHFYNERHADRASPWWTWGVAAACGVAIVALSMAGPAEPGAAKGRRVEVLPSTAVRFADVEQTIISRCSMCHADEPVWTGMTVPPKNVRLDTAERIRAHAHEIAIHAVHSNAMPPSNITEMTGEERALLAAWARSLRSAQLPR